MSESASKDCDSNKIRGASEFAKALTKEIISAGHSVAVLATEEPVKTEQGRSIPLVFDWEVLRAVDECLMRTGDTGGRPLAAVFMRDNAMQTKISGDNATLIRKLQSTDAIQVHHIEADLYSGGEYRDWQTEFCHGMVAIGGGKGTYQVADKMLKASRPVMPMDVELGAYSEDGRGAVQLLSEMKSDAKTFLPRNYQLVGSKLYALSLESPCWSVERVAYTVAAILSDETRRRGRPRFTTSVSPSTRSFGQVVAHRTGHLLRSEIGRSGAGPVPRCLTTAATVQHNRRFHNRARLRQASAMQPPSRRIIVTVSNDGQRVPLIMVRQVNIGN